MNPYRHIASRALCFALASLASPVIAAPIDVLPGTPEVACPDRVAVRGALVAQVGDAAPAPGWRLTYLSTGDTAGDGHGALRVQLADDRGQSRLRRQLRVEGGDCHARAEAIALIVYRFFAELADPGSEAVALSPPPSPPPAFARASPPPPPPSRPPLRLSLEAGGGLWTRRPGTGTTVLGVRVGQANVEAAVTVLAPRAPAVERHAGGGEVEVSALGVAIGLGLVRQGARLRLHGGPMAIVSRESARTRGIAVPAENAGTTAALGLTAGASGQLPAGFHLGLDAGLAHAVFGDRFVVGGWGRVLPPPPWQGVVLARLGYAFSP